MSIAGPRAGVEIARALGLDVQRLKSFTVDCRPDNLVEIRAVYLAQEPVDGAWTEINRCFQLVERDPE